VRHALSFSRGAMKLLCCVGAILSIAFSSMAFAGDRSQFEVIGYSQDKSYFAFEEFGVIEASGHPYASMHLVDLTSNKPVKGWPYNVHLESETHSVSDARRQAAALAKSALNQYDISLSARAIIYRADGDDDAQSQSLQFSSMAHFTMSSTWRHHELIAKGIPMGTASGCEDFEQGPVGVQLIYSYDDSQRMVYVDDKLPRSRHCPLSYNPTAVYIPFEAENIVDGVALISVWSQGFEGPDRRFIAISITNKE